MKYKWMNGADVEIMVYTGILVTRKYLDSQKISDDNTALIANFNMFLWNRLIKDVFCHINYIRMIYKQLSLWINCSKFQTKILWLPVVAKQFSISILAKYKSY